MKKIISYFCIIVGMTAVNFISSVHAAVLCQDVLESGFNVQIKLNEPLLTSNDPNVIENTFLCYEGLDISDPAGTTKTQYYEDYMACKEHTQAALDQASNKPDQNSTIYKSMMSCPQVQFIISDKPLETLSYYIQQLYVWTASIIGIIAVGGIAVSGIMISTSQGENIDAHKTRITQALSAIALLFLSGLILYTINPGFFTQ